MKTAKSINTTKSSKKITSNKTVTTKSTPTQKNSSTVNKAAPVDEDTVKRNGDLIITLNGGLYPVVGRIMALDSINYELQPFGIDYQVVQCGFGHEINYDITFYLVGKTVKYSGVTSGEFLHAEGDPSEVPAGKEIKIVINFYLNGKTYTTTGYRAPRDN